MIPNEICQIRILHTNSQQVNNVIKNIHIIRFHAVRLDCISVEWTGQLFLEVWFWIPHALCCGWRRWHQQQMKNSQQTYTHSMKYIHKYSIWMHLHVQTCTREYNGTTVMQLWMKSFCWFCVLSLTQSFLLLDTCFFSVFISNQFIHPVKLFFCSTWPFGVSSYYGGHTLHFERNFVWFASVQGLRHLYFNCTE